MSVLGPGGVAKIYFMEGFDGASESDTYEEEWIRYRMWHTASHDTNSPSAQSPLTGTLPIEIDSGDCHIPAGVTWPATDWYQGKDRFVILQSPSAGGVHLEGKSLCGLLWRSGSNEDAAGETLFNNGFRDVVSGSTAYCGFAFKFAGVTDGCLKVWMGNSDYNGKSGLFPKYPLPDPGEPSRWWNGNNGVAHQFQEARLALEITLGTSDNILLYRSDSTIAGSKLTDWAVTGSATINPNVWYWGVWEVNPMRPGPGKSAFYLDGSLKAESNLECRDGDSGMIFGQTSLISNLGFAFRGTNQGKPIFDPDVGENFSGNWLDINSPLNAVSLDDIVLFHDKKPPETYCIILSSSAVQTSSDFTPTGAVSLFDCIEENTGASEKRLPATGSWNFTTVPNTNFLNIKYAKFPEYEAGVTPNNENTNIHGVQSLAFCSRDNAIFDTCFQSLSSDPGTTEIFDIKIGTPGTGDDGSDNPYVYISNRVWPSSSVGGVDWEVNDINDLTGSIILGN